jgi:tellurite resistance protein
MALLVEAAVADGRIEPEERALLLASAASLGIEAGTLEDRIARRLRASSEPRA